MQEAEWIVVDEHRTSSLVTHWVVFENIASFLDDASLLKARLVCRAWCASADLSWAFLRAIMAEIRRSAGDGVCSLRTAIQLSHAADEAMDWVDEDVVIRKQKSALCVIAVEENERYVPGKGFRKTHLRIDPPPWRQLSGPSTDEVLELHCAQIGGGQWRGEWRLADGSRAHDTDGWVYGTCFQTLNNPPKSLCQPFKKLTSLVRRRTWIRTADIPLS